MSISNKISLRFVITLLLASAANHAVAQQVSPMPSASSSPAVQTIMAQSDSLPPAPALENATETQAASKRDPARAASETLEVELRYSYENLTNGFAPWQSAQLFVGKKFASRQSLYGVYRETSRVRQRDREALVGLYQPLTRHWAVLLEAQASPSHRVLPQWSALAQIERQFGSGWIGSASYRHTVYNTAQVNTGAFNLERYFSRYRAAYTLYVSALEGAETSASHRAQFDYYYGEQSNSFGVSLAAGRELENLGTRILRTPVQSFTMQGRHWINPRWGINYDFTLHRQGDIYTSRGIGVGLRYRF